MDRSTGFVYRVLPKREEGRIKYSVERIDQFDSVTWTGTFSTSTYPTVVPDYFYTLGDIVFMVGHYQDLIGSEGEVCVWNSPGEPAETFKIAGAAGCITTVDLDGQLWVIRRAPRHRGKWKAGQFPKSYDVFGQSGHLRSGEVIFSDDLPLDSMSTTHPKFVSILPNGHWLCLNLGISEERPERNYLTSFVIDPSSGQIFSQHKQDLRAADIQCVPVEIADVGFAETAIFEYDSDTGGVDIVAFPARALSPRYESPMRAERRMCLLRFSADGKPVPTSNPDPNAKILLRQPSVDNPRLRIISHTQSDRTTMRTLLVDGAGSFVERVSTLNR